MFRKILPIAFRNIPAIFKVTTLSLGFMFAKYHTKLFQKSNCFQIPTFSTNNIFSQVLPKIIRVELNGQIVGYAYCISQNLMVTMSHELFDKKSKTHQFQFFIGEQKINTKIKCIGSFEQFTFYEAQNSILPALPYKNVALYSPVHVIYNRNFLSIRDGYYVGNQSGYGILDARGQIGSLVLNQNGVVGIVTHIGRDQDQGFIRVAIWNDIKNAVNRLKKNKQSIYLGISVVATTANQGVSIVRVTPKSPLQNHLKMGDLITKINNHPVKNPQDLTRLIMFSQSKVIFEVQSSDKSKKLITIEI